MHDRIKASFYADLFLMLANESNPQMTATEVAERHEEKLLMLGPVLERMHNEIIDPLIETTFTRMVEAGIVPPAPEEMQGMDLNVEFVSMLAQAQRAIATNSVDRYVSHLGAVAQIKPEVLDKLDADYWADMYADSLGIDPKLIVSSEKVALIRQQRQQAAWPWLGGEPTRWKRQARTLEIRLLAPGQSHMHGRVDAPAGKTSQVLGGPAMIALLDPKTWLAAVLVAGISGGIGYWRGSAAGRASVQARWDKAKAAAIEAAARAKDQDLSKGQQAITFQYGQRHAVELERARWIAQDLGVKQTVLDLSLMQQITHNTLMDNTAAIETGANGLPNTFVDGRNALFLLYAAIYAKGQGIRHIIAGVCETDFSGYPDYRDVFVKSMNVTLNLAMDYAFQIHTPLMYLTKAQTWALADEMGRLNYIRKHTHTCYNGVVGGCHECPSCLLRERGLAEYLTSVQAGG